MNGVIQWFARNNVAANLLLVGLVVGGFTGLSTAKREVFPTVSTDMVSVSVAYLGAAPAEVEEGVCIKVEEAIESIEGIKKITSSAMEGMGTIRAELDGVVNEVASEFQQGSFFSKGDVLLELDATDYEAVVAQAESQLAGARLKLETIQAESKLARQDWEALSSQFHDGATPLLLREPQLKEAQATVRAAEAAWVKARKDLERTRIRAPCHGRILAKSVDRGQFVRRGQELARVFDLSKVEIQLPVAVSELAFQLWKY